MDSPEGPLLPPDQIFAPGSSPSPTLSPENRIASATPHTIRWVELGLLLAVAFGPSLYASVAALLGDVPSTAAPGNRWLFSAIRELTSLALLAYLLHKQGRSFRDLGLKFKANDLWYVPCLLVLNIFLGQLIKLGLLAAGLYSVAARTSHAAAVARVLDPHFSWGMLIFLVIVAFYEELIVRAYLMTDLVFLTGSTALAVAASTLFQAAYHLYQGWQAALAAGASFLVFSLFYVWTGRITPIILTHFLWDLIAYIQHLDGGLFGRHR